MFGGRLIRSGALLAMAMAVACGEGAERAPRSARVDDFGDTLAAGVRAQRIVSLNPVTTEMFFALGAGSRLVGRTKYDLYPDAARDVTSVGDGMQPNVEAVLGVRPDLVVLYASESNRAAVRALRGAGVATITLRTDHISDLRRTAAFLSAAIGDSAAGTQLADSVERSLDAVRRMPRPERPPRVFFHVWDSPIYTIGRGSYLNELVELVGAANVFGDAGAPSPQVTIEEIVRRNPDIIIAGPVGQATMRASASWRAVPAVRAGRFVVVDTAIVGRPGVRLGEAARHLRALLIPSSGR